MGVPGQTAFRRLVPSGKTFRIGLSVLRSNRLSYSPVYEKRSANFGSHSRPIA